MQYQRVIEHSESPFEKIASTMVYDAIQAASNGTDRSEQQREFKLGASNIGHCRQHAVLMIRQTPPSDERDVTAAFIGTVLGDAIEKQLKVMHPNLLVQEEGHSTFLSGGGVDTHADLVIPWEGSATVKEFEEQEARREKGEDVPYKCVQGVWDLKSKDKLDYVKQYGPSQQQIFQLTQYVNAMIRKGLLNPDEPIWINDVYYDRSGAQPVPYTFGMWYDPDILIEIDQWVEDVKYAVINGQDASRDKAREWCWAYCEYATVCRGGDTDAEGLIEDPEILSYINSYAAANERESSGKKEKDRLKKLIPPTLSGTTGTHTVRWVEVGPSEMKAYTRAGFTKLDIRPIPGPKAPRKPRAKKEA
ncbi:hypothetical protein WILDE_62 [Arthrobacter phage Wilde]|uniref:Uncharacterized protein n=1 Tax=Arthrobacter phage Wilde TaxID=1772323 RepID=A0A0U4B7W5_9CAUD|nr:hypothetical protein WILDE_62 [Arthrobacter phage Wilde]